ncbi:hypothetical protein VI817_004883 [Penicillium citrinum]|nr:hypothetical protein VI817_004883 [Penicillium citrinum]
MVLLFFLLACIDSRGADFQAIGIIPKARQYEYIDSTSTARYQGLPPLAVLGDRLANRTRSLDQGVF